MATEPTLDAFLDALSAEAATAGSVAAAALAGAVAAALVMKVARTGLHAGDDDRLRTVLEEAGRARRGLEALLGPDEGAEDPEALLAHAEQASSVLDLALQILTHPNAGTPDAMATLTTAAALARAATDGLTGSVGAHLGAITDNLTRTAYRSRISGLVGRVRRAEADFMAAAVRKDAGG